MSFNNIQVQVFGTSHSEKIGVNVKNFPAGFKVDLVKLQSFVNRRKASNSSFSTSRVEEDKIVCDSGLDCGVTSKDMSFSIINKNVRSNDYNSLKYIPRPSHADYPAMLKYGIDYDLRGGGEFSGRMTAPICIAGGIAKQILKSRGIEVFAYVSQIGQIKALSYEDRYLTSDELESVANKPLPVFTHEEEIIKLFDECRKNCNSVGGKIECIVRGIKGGLGSTLFDGIEGRLSSAIFAIPSVKAVEFGIGTKFAESFGASVNDEYKIEDNKVKIVTNNNGGLLGGMTTGEDINIRATLKPTPSISRVQHSVNLSTMQNEEISIKGRHDVCHTPRAVAVMEAVVCLDILDILGD